MKITYSLSEIDDVAMRLISSSKSKILLFYGDMGSGKTTLIKALCKQLNVLEKVTSPTFSIVNEYVTTTNERIYHFDFYRIKEESEVLDMGFEQYLSTGDWIFIEWPEKIKNFLPEDGPKVIFNRLLDKRRELRLI